MCWTDKEMWINAVDPALILIFRWFGDFVLSKSCENSIVCWKSGSLDQSEKEKEQRTTIIHKLDVSIIMC